MKLLVIDGQEIVHFGFRALFDSTLGIKLFPTMYGQNGVALYVRRKPNVVIMEMNLPDSYGPDIAHDILTLDKNARIVFFTSEYSPAVALEAFEVGAFGFVNKNSSAADIRASITAVSKGQRWLPKDLIQDVALLRASTSISSECLTARDKGILRGLANAKSLKQIAAEMKLAHKYIFRSCQNLQRRADARTKEDLVRIATDLGLLS